MCIDREHHKLHFFIQSSIKDQIDINKYNVCIQSTKGTVLETNWKKFYLNTDPLYEVCLKTLCLNNTTYLSNNTLSIRFMFQSYTIVSHYTMFKCISGTSNLTAANYYIFDKFNSFVTFIVDGKRLRINKSLICAASSVIDNILEKYNSKENEDDEIKITDTTYDIFKLVIYYIETRGVFELNLDADNDTHENILLDLMSVANKFNIKDLKVMCENRIIKYVTKENVLKYLDFAISNNAVDLASYAKRLINLHLDDIINTTEFLEKIRNDPIMLSDILRAKSKKKILFLT